ncbi:hypothetical protein Hanom_Chr07g00621921 [Helianthus anomalus]
MSVVCGPHVQTSVTEEVDQTSAVCKKKTICFLTFALEEEVYGGNDGGGG